MQMSEETRDELNRLIGRCFEMNSFCDNVAYELGYYNFPHIEKIFHLTFAHAFTGDKFADGLSDFMLELEARPVRLPVPEHSKSYNGNLIAMFDDVLLECEKFRQDIIRAIEIAELNEDMEVKIYLEDLIEDFVPYRKQAKDWATQAHRYAQDEVSFDIHFDAFSYLE